MVYDCHYLTWLVSGEPNAVQFGEWSQISIHTIKNI